MPSCDYIGSDQAGLDEITQQNRMVYRIDRNDCFTWLELIGK